MKEFWERWHEAWNACPRQYANAEAYVHSSKPDINGRRWVDLAETSRGRGYIVWAVESAHSYGRKPPLNLYLAVKLAIHTAPAFTPTFEDA